MRGHEQHVGTPGIVARRSHFHGEDGTALDRRADRIELDRGICRSPGGEGGTDAGARLVERLVHTEGIGGGGGGSRRRQGSRDVAAARQQSRRRGLDDDDGVQRTADRANARHLETQGGQRIDAGGPGDLHLSNPELCRRSRGGREQQER